MQELRKLTLEAGPLVLFFIANFTIGLMVATAGYVIATLLALGASWLWDRRVPLMPLIGGVFVVLFGVLTLTLDSALFIKIKPTVVNILLATILLTGLVARRNWLKLLLGGTLHLDEAGWRQLTLRWAVFFLVLAAVNELVWRNFSTDFWVTFKVFGIMPLSIVFAVAQVPLIMKHQEPPAEASS